jgi:hypothetical protein
MALQEAMPLGYPYEPVPVPCDGGLDNFFIGEAFFILSSSSTFLFTLEHPPATDSHSFQLKIFYVLSQAFNFLWLQTFQLSYPTFQAEIEQLLITSNMGK